MQTVVEALGAVCLPAVHSPEGFVVLLSAVAVLEGFCVGGWVYLSAGCPPGWDPPQHSHGLGPLHQQLITLLQYFDSGLFFCNVQYGML